MGDKALYQEILRQLVVEHALCDATLNIVANSTGLAHLGQGRTLVGRSLVEVFDFLAGLEPDLLEVCRGERPSFQLELVQHTFASGRSGYVTMTAGPYDGGLLIVLNEVSRLAEQHQHIMQQRNELSLAHHRLGRLVLQMDELLGRLVPATDRADAEGAEDAEGAKYEALVPQAQMVTILFADLEGILAAAEQMSEDRLLGMFDDRLAQGVERIFAAGGHLDQFAGDAVMGFFASQELGADHAFQAVKAAWEFVHATEGNYFSFGVGVSSGLARLARLADGDEIKETAIGEVTRQARAVNGLAGSNQVLITADTYDLVKNKVEVEPAGETVLADNKTPIRLYNVLRLH